MFRVFLTALIRHAEFKRDLNLLNLARDGPVTFTWTAHRPGFVEGISMSAAEMTDYSSQSHAACFIASQVRGHFRQYS